MGGDLGSRVACLPFASQSLDRRHWILVLGHSRSARCPSLLRIRRAREEKLSCFRTNVANRGDRCLVLLGVGSSWVFCDCFKLTMYGPVVLTDLSPAWSPHKTKAGSSSAIVSSVWTCWISRLEEERRGTRDKGGKRSVLWRHAVD